MESLFIINSAGNVFLEKHWKSYTSKDILKEHFLDKLRYGEDIPPIIQTSVVSTNIVSVKREDLHFVSICKSEIPPLMVIEFLHRVFDNFLGYFSSCSEKTIKDNYVLVYELLDEMLDNGFPMATEMNFLKELVRPPSNALSKLANSVTGRSNLSGTLPSGSLSVTPWRKSNVQYTNNEIYFDIVESIHAIIDRTGATISAEISGTITCDCKLSGRAPNLLLSFADPRIFDDVSFHQCVRLKRWESERVLSFIPPDRGFQLMSYIINTQTVPIPVYIHHYAQSKSDDWTKLDITIGPRSTCGQPLENVKIDMPFPNEASSCSFIHTQGKATFNESSKQLHWDIGKVNQHNIPNIKISVKLAPGISISGTSIDFQFTIAGIALSRMRVSQLDLCGDMFYKPFKGVKYETRAGKFQARL